MRNLLFCAALFMLVVPGFAFAQERIVSFDATAQVKEDGSALISEAIIYDFGESQRHGIYRTIPLNKKMEGQYSKIKLSNVQVTDETGTPYEFEIVGFGEKEIKIGDADVFVTGQHTYIISYTLSHAVGFFDTGDELYWNVTGTGWQVPIEKASAVIRLSKAIPGTQMQAACYVGQTGASAPCQKAIMGSGSATFEHGVLALGEGLTVALGFPKGIVVPPTVFSGVMQKVLTYVWLLIPLSVFMLLLRKWQKEGRDPKGRGAIPVQYDAPAGLSPVAIGILHDSTVSHREITAEIVHLAEQGYLKIHRVEEKKLAIFNTTDYALIKLKEAGSELKEYQRILLEALFEGKYMDEATIDGVPTNVSRVSKFAAKKFYISVKQVQEKAMAYLVGEGYFRKDPKKVKAKYIGLGAFATYVATWLLAEPALALAVFLSGIITIIFAFLLPAFTKKGVEAKEHVIGLRGYIEAAEKRRIEFHNAPEKNPQEFERLLPAAIALGIEKKWAKQFEGMLIEPKWYGGQTGSFNAVMLAGSLGDFQSAAGASFSGTSGSSGGGGVGGGGGGGGGGSW